MKKTITEKNNIRKKNITNENRDTQKQRTHPHTHTDTQIKR